MSESKKNLDPESMTYADGFVTGRMRVAAAKAAGKPYMLVDNAKAHSMIRDLLAADRKIARAELGLEGDWGYNNAIVYDGEFHDYNEWGGSMWATPTLIVYFTDGTGESFECWKPEESVPDEEVALENTK